MYSRHSMVRSSNCSASCTKSSTAFRTPFRTSCGVASGCAFSAERKSWFPQRPVPAGWESAADDARVLLHCYSGSLETAYECLDLGLAFSFGGAVTFKNAKKPVEVVMYSAPESETILHR